MTCNRFKFTPTIPLLPLLPLEHSTTALAIRIQEVDLYYLALALYSHRGAGPPTPHTYNAITTQKDIDVQTVSQAHTQTPHSHRVKNTKATKLVPAIAQCTSLK